MRSAVRVAQTALALSLVGCASLLGTTDVPSPEDASVAGDAASSGSGSGGSGSGSSSGSSSSGASGTSSSGSSSGSGGSDAGAADATSSSGSASSGSGSGSGSSSGSSSSGSSGSSSGSSGGSSSSGGGGVCTPSTLQCSGLQPQLCNSSGTAWQNVGAACTGGDPGLPGWRVRGVQPRGDAMRDDHTAADVRRRRRMGERRGVLEPDVRGRRGSGRGRRGLPGSVRAGAGPVRVQRATADVQCFRRLAERHGLLGDHSGVPWRRMRGVHFGQRPVLRQRGPDVQHERAMGKRGGVHPDHDVRIGRV